MQHFVLHQVAVKLCLSCAQSTALTRMKNILPELREERLPPQTTRVNLESLAALAGLPQDLPRHSQKLNLAQKSGKKSAVSICFPERIKLANFSLIREAKPAASLTDSSGRMPRLRLPGCPGARLHCGTMPGPRSGGSTPAFVPVSRHRKVLPLLPGNSSL